MMNNKNGKIYLEAILDLNNNCERIDRSRIYNVNPEKIFMKSIIKENIIVMTYEYWKNLEIKYSGNPKLIVILINDEDLKKFGHEYYKDKKEYIKFNRFLFKEVHQYSPYTLHELQSTYKATDIFILGDSRLYWKYFDLADKLIITHVDKCYHQYSYDLIQFPKIENEIWRETMGSILDSKTTAVEYERRNIKGWDD